LAASPCFNCQDSGGNSGEKITSKTGVGTLSKVWERLQSKGFKARQIKSIIGNIKWKRRLGRCPNKCTIGQIAPFDEELGLAANQKSDAGLQQVACLVAIFVPFEAAAMLLKQMTGNDISGQAIWKWVQAAGSNSQFEKLAWFKSMLKHLYN